MNRLKRILIGEGGGRELYFIAISLIFLVVAICAVWFVQVVLGVEGDAILIALLILPLVLYLSLSGRVGELTAGDLTVKLNEASREPVGQTSQYVVADLGPRSDPTRPIQKTDPNRPQVVTLTNGGGPYNREKVLSRLRNLAAISPVPLLIVLDNRERVLAYMTYRSALGVLQHELRGEQFIELVNADNPDAFDGGGGFSFVKTETIPDTTTNAEALSAMVETGLDALIVVDRKGRFGGIVERDRVLSKMMLAMVSKSSTR